MDLSPLKIDRGGAAPRSAPRRRRGGLGPIVAIVLVGAAGWLFWRPLVGIVDRVRLPEVAVAVAQRPSTLAAAALSGTSANGYVIASTRAALSADTPGRIVEMNVKEGDVVKKGFVVARLYADEYRAAVQRAEAEVAEQRAMVALAERELVWHEADADRLGLVITAARADLDAAEATTTQARQKLERAEKMVKDDIESQQWLDDARADHARALAEQASSTARLAAAQSAVAQARRRSEMQGAAIVEAKARIPVLEAALEGARATLDKTEVRAPFDGVVVLKDAEVGEVVSPNSQGGNSRGSVATMVDFATLEVQVEMPERTIAAVKIGAPVRIFLDAWPEHAYAGKVTRIWPVASRAKATIEVRASFDQPDAKLRPEMGARVVFLDGDSGAATESAPPPDGVLVPAAAIVTAGGHTSVFVVERDQVRSVEVTAGDDVSGRVLVTRGLEGRERVVVDPPARLADGDRVRVKGDA